ncbi:metal/formaldehyde-sensitive transcriptional repressor [Flavisphingomonas formosensis]|uniref:metal/formaldehyde-sensitive transcriptional repressor n=1 Tax=Flavisphingomonas formosensis TaxID=861534 RepID=UPI0012FBF8F5|nr:metal/formaldehyde-sensitive transcriptional repressor [Sphingomonas formosensis]
MAHLSSHNDALLKRVRRIAGQVAAIERALTSAAECAETLHLIAATRGAINGLLDEVIEAHLHDHVARPGLGDAERAQGAEELLAAIRRYSK